MSPARNDLARIDDYYRSYASSFGLQLAETAVDAADFLAKYPKAGAAFVADVRKWRVRGTLYVLIYRVRTQLEILRVRHFAEDWQSEP